MTYSLRVAARYLRQESTASEKTLWQHLRNKKLGVKFRRQHTIDRFILDFYAPSKKLGIELDGYQHKENTEYDNNRTDYLKLEDIRLLRFWNSEVEKDLEKVLGKIREAMRQPLSR